MGLACGGALEVVMVHTHTHCCIVLLFNWFVLTLACVSELCERAILFTRAQLKILAGNSERRTSVKMCLFTKRHTYIIAYQPPAQITVLSRILVEPCLVF
jgi:hypothetical protein